MSEANGQNGEQVPGVLGAGSSISPHNGRADTALIERAVRNKWLIPEQAYSIVPSEMVKIVVGLGPKGQPAKYSTRNRISAARVVATFHGQNEAAAQPSGSGVTVNVGVAVGMQAVRQELLADERYLDYLDSDSGHSDASPVRGNGQPGPVGASETPVASQPTNPANANGNGRH